jgi:aryl-alcohol dehydrogenase-like predicted oxidoreductase
MRQHPFGPLGLVSTLTLGGGGLGMLWGQTTFEECVATVKAAVDAGVTLLDLAPRYGDGKAERVVGEAFGGRLPAGVRVTSKCNLGNPPPERVEPILRQSIEGSLRLLQRDRLDLFFLHSNLVPDSHPMWQQADTSRFTPLSLFTEVVQPAFDRLVRDGMIGAWGVTGIGHPDAIIQVLGEDPRPAAVQCIANLLDSPGGLKFLAIVALTVDTAPVPLLRGSWPAR